MSRNTETTAAIMLIAGLGVIAIPVVTVGIAFYEGWALSVLWRWVAVERWGWAPVGVLDCTIAAMAINMVANETPAWKDHERDRIQTWAKLLLRPIVVLSVAWLCLRVAG